MEKLRKYIRKIIAESLMKNIQVHRGGARE